MIDLLRRIDHAVLRPLHEFYPRLLDRASGNAESLLDVGCGSRSPAFLATRRMRYSVGIDGFESAIERSRAAGIHNRYIRCDLADLEKVVAPKSFDVVVCSDVIEHVTKDDGFRLMAAMERVAKKRVIIGTPNGFMPQDGSFEGNCLQEHVSGWRIWDFEDRGYQLCGFGGWKPMKGPYAKPKWWPGPFWHRVSMLTEPLLLRVPSLSFQLLAIKEVAT